ncbi:MAG TPA: class A beta-lactamase-related serine hydrolase [Bacteroides sp.]|nr:class A beta-lactamase-related serine hydrolase [Bacteroides sp.]
MKKLKFIIVQFVLILVLFFWDIGSIFSDRKASHPVQSNELNHRSGSIQNNMSSFKGTDRMEKTISDFLKRYKIKGASVAVTKEGRLVYAKGFGYANEESEELVDPNHVFRLASVSKLVTSIAVMRLEEEGKLSLDEKVFGPEGILNDSLYLKYRDPRIESITVRHLLVHRAGWSRYYGDPMFMPHVVARNMHVELPVKSEDVIRYALTRKLNYKPGTRYSYSNLGYSILGEIIEKLTGMDYEDYVQLSLLQPLGIWDMQIGQGYYEEKAPREVKYYEISGNKKVLAFDSRNEYVPRVYGGNDIALLGAAGGWIGSPAEMLRLGVAIDGFNSSPDILLPETIEKMTKNKGGRYNMIGWKGTDGSGTWWRTGTLTGSSALMVRQENGLNWIIVMNTTTWKRSRIHSETSRTMFRALSTVKEWPEYDLFDYQKPVELPSMYLTRTY